MKKLSIKNTKKLYKNIVNILVNNIVLKLSFRSKEDTTILSLISQDLKVEFSILSANIDDYNNKIIGNVFISFNLENEELIKNYLSEKNIVFDEVSEKQGGEL